MAWEFSTDPDYEKQLAWVRDFVAAKIAPLDLVLGSPYNKSDARAMALARPLQDEVRLQGLWAAHLRKELGGGGYGQVKLALLNELLGNSRWAPSIFGCQAPDSGNAEILAHFGTEWQKQQYLQPLLDGTISSCYAMTEPHAGADPALFTTRAVRDGDHWVINGEKWFCTNARWASFFIVMVVTDPEVSIYRGMSIFLVPAGTPGLEIVRNVGVGGEPEDDWSHAYLRFTDLRVPADHLLGEPGDAFAIAQTRLGGGRLHHAMRTIGQVRAVLDMLCERALSRRTRTGLLADYGTVQEAIADSWIKMEQFRLLVLRTAWLIDRTNDYRSVRKDIAAVKAAMPEVFHDVVLRAMHIHGALGVSTEMPFANLLIQAETMALVDGPTEVHKATVARQLLREYEPVSTLFPSEHIPTRRATALADLANRLEHEVVNS